MEGLGAKVGGDSGAYSDSREEEMSRISGVAKDAGDGGLWGMLPFLDDDEELEDQALAKRPVNEGLEGVLELELGPATLLDPPREWEFAPFVRDENGLLNIVFVVVRGPRGAEVRVSGVKTLWASGGALYVDVFSGSFQDVKKGGWNEAKGVCTGSEVEEANNRVKHA
jgi:hypothetical protein